MTERERWIVYPLLFLALGAALRDKLVDRTVTKSIVCQELSIVDEGVNGPQSQRVLARIGRAKPASGGKSVGILQMYGDIELVDEELSSNLPVRMVAKLGRTETIPNIPSTGYLFVRGEVLVDGTVNARQYIYQGMPIVPLQVVPGVPMPNVLQALPHSGSRVPPVTPPKQSTPPPADQDKKGDEASQREAPADKSAAPAK